MKTQTIVSLLKQGKKPLLRLTGALQDDSWGSEGMITRAVSFTETSHDGMVEIEFDFNEHKTHNLALQSHDYYLNNGELGTAFDANLMKPDNIRESVHFELTDDMSAEPADSPILKEFLKSESDLTYVTWLETQLESLVPDCMKPWGDSLTDSLFMNSIPVSEREPTQADADWNQQVLAWDADKGEWTHRSFFDFPSHPAWSDQERAEIRRRWPRWRGLARPGGEREQLND